MTSRPSSYKDEESDWLTIVHISPIGSQGTSESLTLIQYAHGISQHFGKPKVWVVGELYLFHSSHLELLSELP
jgi:hypothetical protein